jgi:hypothetical protein
MSGAIPTPKRRRFACHGVKTAYGPGPRLLGNARVAAIADGTASRKLLTKDSFNEIHRLLSAGA